MNKPEGGYCESCVGDNAATDYAPTEQSAGGTATWRDAWIDPAYRGDPEQERWHQGWWPFGQPAAREHAHEAR